MKGSGRGSASRERNGAVSRAKYVAKCTALDLLTVEVERLKAGNRTLADEVVEIVAQNESLRTQLAACRAALRKAVDALNWVSMTVYERDALRDDLAALDAALADGGE